MIGFMSLEEQVDKDFSIARRRALFGRLAARLRGHPERGTLLAFDETRRKLRADNKIYLGRRVVEVSKILGSVGRHREFDCGFMPAKAGLAERWKRVDRAFHRGVELPPVRLQRLGGVYYFVEDGNHRVSVARYQGVEWIDADVVGLGSPLSAAQRRACCRERFETAAVTEADHANGANPNAVGKTIDPTPRTKGPGMTVQREEQAMTGGKRFVALGLLIVALMIFLLTAKPAQAADTFTVDNTLDPGDGNCNQNGLGCTLREAINAANSNPGADLIRFNIQSPGVQTIRPASPLPEIVGALTIDGYTQPGASPNTLATGTNAKPMIELDGTQAGAANGLVVRGDLGDGETAISGLTINRFGLTGIFVFEASANSVRVEGNFVGTDASGILDRGNGNDGVAVSAGASGLFVGGSSPAARNLISGNADDGVDLRGVSGVTVEGNLIGTKKNGTGALSNSGSGVDIVDSEDLLVGGGTAGARNTVAFNGGDGVRIASDSSTGALVFGNSVFSNGGLGVDLAGGFEDAAGNTANDPGDLDSGPNGLQNKPVVSSAKSVSSKTTVAGKLAGQPNSLLTVQFFSNPSANEGKKFIGQRSVTTDGSGNASFVFSPAQKVATGQTITATASNNVTRDTSEFSASRMVVTP